MMERGQFAAVARQLIQFDRSQLAFRAASRLVPAMVVVLAVALFFNAPGAGAVAAASAYIVGVGSFQQFTRSRAGPMLFAWAGAVLSTFIGTLAGGSTVTMALVALIYGFWCGLLPAIGMGAFWVGQQCAVFLLIAGAYAGGLGPALGRTSLVLVGGAVQMACFAAMLFLAEGRARVPSPVGLIDDFRVAMLRLEFPVRQRSALFGFALRFAVTLVAAVATERVLAIPNGYWVAMTALLLMRPDFQDTLARGLGRVGGTIAGAAAASALSHFYAPGRVALAALVASFAFLGYATLRLNFVVFAFCVTSYVIFLLVLAGVAEPRVAEARILATLLGAGFALLAHLDFYRVRQRRPPQAT